MYSIRDVAKLSGVSTRTLRYYDEIDLLKPHFIKDNGYRMYSEKELDLLQIILFYRYLEVPLSSIKQILMQNTDKTAILISQKSALLKKQAHIQSLIKTIDETLMHYKGAVQMTEQEKFEAFKNETIKANETKYGDELKEKYDQDTIEQSVHHFKHLTKNQFDEAKSAEVTLITNLNNLLDSNIQSLDHPYAKNVFVAHKTWLQIMSGKYSKTYHQALAQMYVVDARFADYYNSRTNRDSVELLSQIIMHYTN